jgi:hypothetical protein
MEAPNTRSGILKNKLVKELENLEKKTPKVCTLLKSCEPLYTCSRAPFYIEMKRLLHSEITLGTKEYFKWEHVHECLLHPVICGANFIHLETNNSFTP